MMLYTAYLDLQQCCFLWSDLLRNTGGSLSNLRMIYILSAEAQVRQPSDLNWRSEGHSGTTDYCNSKECMLS